MKTYVFGCIKDKSHWDVSITDPKMYVWLGKIDIYHFGGLYIFCLSPYNSNFPYFEIKPLVHRTSNKGDSTDHVILWKVKTQNSGMLLNPHLLVTYVCTKVYKDPDHANYCDKHVKSVPSTGPVASWCESYHLHYHLENNQNFIIYILSPFMLSAR